MWIGGKVMKNILAMILYKLLVKYCESYEESCGNCIFSDKRSKCMCIANIPIEWDKPKIK
jgi:hypothetical protein